MFAIVNADDLGANDEINEATFELMERGVVTSASLLANGPKARQALRKSLSFEGASFGIHLNLTEFAPLTNDKSLSPLLDATGQFRSDSIREVPLNVRLLKAIYSEWSAQIRFAQAMGVAPSHIDSHHHVHTIPSLFPILKALQVRFGLRKVRNTKNIYSETAPGLQSLLRRKHAWEVLVRCTSPTRMTEGFTNFDEFRLIVDRGDIEHWVRDASRQTFVEVMVHPGNGDYSAEIAALSLDWFASRGIALASYKEL